MRCISMSLKDRLNADFKDALKKRDSIRKNVINMARAAIKQYEVDNREELDEQGVENVIAKQIKMRRDALKDFKKGGREDLVAEYQAEIDVLSQYMPKQLTEEEVTQIVKEVMLETGIQDKKGMGKLMGAVMPKVKGKADGNIVRKVVENILQ